MARPFPTPTKHGEGVWSLLPTPPEVFAWVRHLDPEEARAFTVELLDALSDAAELGGGKAVHRALVSWTATARINADPEQLKAVSRPLDGEDPGPVEGTQRPSRRASEPEAGATGSMSRP